MLLSKQDIINRLTKSMNEDAIDPLIVTPFIPGSEDKNNEHAASLDIHLGTWFVTTKARKWSLIDIYNEKDKAPPEEGITDKYYIPFGKKFILHPNQFVLAITLEWIRVPLDLSVMITGKSSWGRRGLIVETAPGVHPGFSGCLTLEMTNVGNIAIAIMPGTEICQIFFQNLLNSENKPCSSRFFGKRQPCQGIIEESTFAKKLRR